MRIFYFLLIIVCLHTNQSNAQCAGQVDSVFFSTSNEYCGNANGQLLITNTRGGIAGQTLQYQLNDGAAQASNVFSNLTAGNYTLVITELPSGCQYTYPKPIVVANKRSFTSISANPVATTGCNTNDGQITVVPVGGIAPNTYQLDGGAFVNTSVFINVPAGIHYIVVKDSKGCDTIVSANVPQPTGITFVNYATYPTSCTSNTGSVKIKSVTGTTPTTMQIDGSVPITYNDSIVGLALGEHKITLIDAAGCKFEINTIYIPLQPPYTAYTVHVVTDTCSKNVGQIFITNNAGGAVPCTFALDASTTYTANALFSNLPKGTHTLHIKDSNGCLKDTTLTVPTTYKPQGTPVLTHPTCGLTDGQINITPITGAGAPYTLTCNGTTTNGTNPFTNLGVGTYTIKITDGLGCDSAQQVTLIEQNKITSINALLTNIVCGSNLGSINVISVAGGVAPYLYAFNGASQTAPTKTALPKGTYAITITDNNNCKYDTVVVLTQTNPFDCALTATPTNIVTGESSTITSNATGTTNVWTGSGAETATTTSVTVAPTVTTNYTLTTSTPEGCIATCSTTVIVQPKIIVYKAFSPNADGKNDTWELTYLSYYPKAEISVYSRWGELVYRKKTDDTYTPFDGKSTSGTKLTTGTYFYFIDLNAKDVSNDYNYYKGFVELIQ